MRRVTKFSGSGRTPSLRRARLWGFAPLCLALAASCGGGGEGDEALPEDTTPPDTTSGPEGVGTDLAASAACLSCHTRIAESWANPSAHRQLLGCTGCHERGAEPPAPGHAGTPTCSTCHSQSDHSSQGCTTCHDQHGSENAYLIRASLRLAGGGRAEIHFTEPTGATPDGLVRTGVAGATAGTGLCEVCHSERVDFYNRTGTGKPHPTTWCGECHDHQRGLRAGR